MQNQKYKVVISEGCINFNTIVNDKDINDFTKEELNEFYDYVLKAIKEGLERNEVNFDSVIGCLQYDDFQSDNSACEQCGDTTSHTIWRI